MKESAKETATGAKENLQDTGSRIAEKGRGEIFFLMILTRNYKCELNSNANFQTRLNQPRTLLLEE